ncbi:hypothetical protein ACFSTE_11090 [Aquimarina hainanensis]|uniref:Porin n=1 Tax=Aquimarina hainanensis TaxID=1578017 RepID=A0ABW5N794_9FLAO|nr:hypothetical protein [Aquimarina sp. TRL1]QKX05487.1 hypothetical protein HN014_11355 [Aquimarina sp. TRL1]
MKSSWLVFLFIGSITLTSAQEKKTIFSTMDVNGYLKYMNTSMFTKIDSTWVVDNLVHNRLNYLWDIADNLTVKAGMRNRIIYGDMVRLNPDYAASLEADTGYFHFLTNNLSEGESYVINTTFDRAFLEYSYKNITISAGRQRINWGQSMVWNPNDIFNSYSFFDFDYEERPGSDAVRVQYYPDYTSVTEAVIKIDKDENITMAGLYRFNKWGYDIQLIGGVIDTTDYVLGAGWSGNIKKMGFNGELTYFYPQEKTENTSADVIASAGINYTFKNSVTVTAEGNYNSYFDKIGIEGIAGLYAVPLSVKTITFSKFSWFGQVSYAINPLLSGSLACIYMPSLENGYYITPSLQYSIKDNFELSLLGQRFEMTLNHQKSESNLLFLRMRWSF